MLDFSTCNDLQKVCKLVKSSVCFRRGQNKHKAEQRKELKEVFNLNPQQLTFILWGLK